MEHYPSSLDEFWVAGEVHEKVDVGAEAVDVVLGEAGAQLEQRRVPVLAPHDELGDHGVVVDGHLVALPNSGLDSHVRGGLESK